MPYLRGTLQERFSAKVNKTDTCWLWTGAGNKFYGQIRQGRAGTPMVYAHRVAYELANGPIPKGLQIDHLCRVGYCVRPDHLEAVTPQVNCLRRPERKPMDLGEVCRNGHPRDQNTFIGTNGARACRQCRRDSVRRYNAAHRGGVPSHTIR